MVTLNQEKKPSHEIPTLIEHMSLTTHERFEVVLSNHFNGLKTTREFFLCGRQIYVSKK